MEFQEIIGIAIDSTEELRHNNIRPIAIVVPEAFKEEICKHLTQKDPKAITDELLGCTIVWSKGSLMKAIGTDALAKLLEPQKLYNYVVEQVEIAATCQQTEEAVARMMGVDAGKKLAYMDIARRLVNMGCRAKFGGNDAGS